MGKKIDLTGKIFGRLTVLYELQERKNKRIYWHCICDCGKNTNVCRADLLSKHTQSCGCLQSERTSKARISDLTGKVFGRLLVLAQAGRTVDQRVIWTCVCKCGNNVTIPFQPVYVSASMGMMFSASYLKISID